MKRKPSNVSTLPAPPNELRELRVVSIKTKEIVHRIDVSSKSNSQVEKVLSGMLRNMDTDRYFVEDSADNES